MRRKNTIDKKISGLLKPTEISKYEIDKNSREMVIMVPRVNKKISR